MLFNAADLASYSFTGIHPVVATFLRAVAEDPWECLPEGCTRLLPAPGEEEELCRDWQDHVQPELRRHFDTERNVVARDLDNMKPGKRKNSHWALSIPREHGNAWLTTLNAFRLALSTKHSLCEGDLDGMSPPDTSTERGLAILQVNLYAFVQECILGAMDTMDPDLVSEEDSEGAPGGLD